VQYPNNSKWGIAEAARNQYDRIRFTIRKTTDGYYFLCHNTTINATARNMDGTVISETVSSEGKTLAELNEYDWGIQYGEKFAGMQVPMLEDALYYASLYNLGVTFEISSPIVEADYENLFNLAVKYGLIENLILVKYDTDLYDYFKARNKKVSYWWGGTFAEFELAKDTLKDYLTGENRVYIYNTPYTDYPSTEYLQAIVSNGFTPHFSNIFNENDFIETVKKGIVLIDVANVAFVKSTLRKYADSLID
jgi:glycerophosphoryl diester phosphodiesterase